MGRRRKKPIRFTRRRLPTVFLCPRCGKKSINVIFKNEKKKARVVCGNCSIRDEFNTKGILQEIDVYCRFTDNFYSNKVGTKEST